MREPFYIVFLPDPFGLKRSEFFLRAPDGTGSIIKPKDLSLINTPCVTVEGRRLVAELSALGVQPPSLLLDLEEPLRLLKGTAKHEGGSRVANPWRLLECCDQGKDKTLTVASYRDVFEAKAHWPASGEERLQLYQTVADALKAAWENIRAGLNEASEWDRFEQVEYPVAQVFYARQCKGIRIDKDELTKLIEKASSDKYQAYNRIADVTGVSPSGLNHRNVGLILPNTDAAHLLPFIEAPNFLEYLKLAAENSVFARDLLTLVRAERDLKTLARMRGSEDEFVKPEFPIMGTVTGRILVSNPHLQQVRREYRRAIAADLGKRLAYLDYAQFEPGILASLAEDEELITEYNTGDIYKQLSISIFGDEESRDLAKKMFLAFTYGMSSDRIVALVGGTNQAEQLTAFDTFVAKFEKLAEFREQSETKLQKNGFVETLLGNRRYRSGAGALSDSDRRWAVSQRVQGTAALIFKEAVLQIANFVGQECVMLPMHDAVLMSLSPESFDEDVKRIQDIMLSSLEKRCPQVHGRVVVQEHF